MADIELVIKLSEDSYKATCNGYMLPQDVENVVQGIKNGTPLTPNVLADMLTCVQEVEEDSICEMFTKKGAEQ